MRANQRRRGLTLLLAAMMLLAMGGGALAAPQGSLTMPPAGQNGYTSMHAYVSKTDIAGVYKVRQTISGKVEKIIPTADVVVTVDQSGSMRGPSFSNVPNSGRPIDDAADGMLSMLDVFWNPSKSDQEKGMFRVGIIGHTNNFTSSQAQQTDVSTFPGYNPAVHSIGGQVSYSPANEAALRVFISQFYNKNTAGGENTPLAVNHAYDPNFYFKAKTNPSAPANYKDPDYKFIVVIADGAVSSVLATLNTYRNAGDLDNVFVLGFAGNVFNHNATLVPDIPSDWNSSFIGYNPAYNMPMRTDTSNETALLNISAVFPAGAFPVSVADLGGAGYNAPMSAAVRAQALEYNYYYVHSQAVAIRAFQDIATKIVAQVGPPATGIYASTTIGDGFEIYNYPGKPTFEQSGQPKADGSGDWNAAGTVSSSGKTITWDIDEIPDDGSEIVLTYYIKANEGNTPGLGYEIFKDAYLFYNTVQTIGGIDTPGTIVNLFPVPIITGSGEVEEGSSGGDNSAIPGGGTGSGSGMAAGTGTGTDSGKTGGQGHQDNREIAGGMSSGFGGGQDISPDVKDVKSGKDSSGRTKVQVDLSNGSYMRYQWQYKNAAGEWEDIFGATGSHYTLGKQFVNGKEYQLRVKITNPAGKSSFSEEVKLTMEAGSGAGLQTKEEGPGIASENVSDAGEEISIANTATSPFALAFAAGGALAAIAILAGIARKRRG